MIHAFSVRVKELNNHLCQEIPQPISFHWNQGKSSTSVIAMRADKTFSPATTKKISDLEPLDPRPTQPRHPLRPAARPLMETPGHEATLTDLKTNTVMQVVA